MGRYPKFKQVRQDLLKSTSLQPFGAFVCDGKIIAGWRSVNERVPAIPGIIAMCKSATSDAVIAGTESGQIYSSKTSGTELELDYSDGGSSPFTFETHDGIARAILFSGKTYSSHQNGFLSHAVVTQKLSCGAMRRGRLFGADADSVRTLRWSASGYRNWTEGISGAGNLVLEPSGGSILDIFDFEDRLVVFRERSIMRFSVYGNPENFKEQDTAFTPEIYKRTAAIAGDRILFFTSGGLMSYSGGKIERVDGLITDDLKSPTSSFVYDGRYYFICGTSKLLEKSVVYVYDFSCGGYQIIDIPAYFVSQDAISLLAYAPSTIYRLHFGYEYILYEVITGSIDFGTDKRKLVTELEIDCDDDIRVIISNGRRTKTLRQVNGKTRLNMRGDEFTVTFSGYGGSVRSAYLTAEVIE